MTRTERDIVSKIGFMTMEQQEGVLKYIKDIEVTDVFTIPRIIINDDNQVCTLYVKNNQTAMSYRLGSSVVVAVVDCLRTEHKLLIGEPTAQKAIYEIGSIIPLLPEPTSIIKGRSLETGLPSSIEISSGQLQTLFSQSFSDDFYASLKFALDNTPFRHSISSAELSQAHIILRGFLGYIRGLDHLLQEATGLKVVVE